jgi:uncharacterized NAD-dependent epimerase/dehydratase family protein
MPDPVADNTAVTWTAAICAAGQSSAAQRQKAYYCIDHVLGTFAAAVFKF